MEPPYFTHPVTNWTIGEGNLVIENNMEDLRGINTIYIISEVIYAQKVRVEVEVGNANMSDEINKRIPVAFSYMKFPMDKMGVVQAAKDTKLNIAAEFQLMGEEDKTNRGLGEARWSQWPGGLGLRMANIFHMK